MDYTESDFTESASDYSNVPHSEKRQKYQAPLLTDVQRVARVQHKSIRTERAYIKWISDFIRFHRAKDGCWTHPREMQGKHVSEYLSYLANERNVAKSTQNQAISALLFLFKSVLGFEQIEFDADRAPPSRHLPVVLSVDEVHMLLRLIGSWCAREKETRTAPFACQNDFPMI